MRASVLENPCLSSSLRNRSHENNERGGPQPLSDNCIISRVSAQRQTDTQRAMPGMPDAHDYVDAWNMTFESIRAASQEEEGGARGAKGVVLGMKRADFLAASRFRPPRRHPTQPKREPVMFPLSLELALTPLSG